MSKITFRADDDLVKRVESLDVSKSEVMREALRSYLDDRAERASLDDVLAERVDAMVDARLGTDSAADTGGDVNVHITVETDDRSARVDARREPAPEREQAADLDRHDGHAGRSCAQCGESLSEEHVYCPNCGEKATRRVFCDCGDELRSDWAYCPACGRRTPSADVLEG